MPTIGVVIPTLCGRRHLSHCLYPFLRSPLRPRILVVDSSSNDQTAEYARELGVEVLVIPASEFNHGCTRELGRRYLNTDIIVMVTQDCYAVNSRVLEKLIEPLINKRASVAYARQHHHVGAGILESFLRHFNYPSKSHIRNQADVQKHGSNTFFCSNSCAAYLNSALEEIGGFDRVLLGEDTVAVAKLLKKGHQVAYVADAVVRHSHSYTLREEFKRSFNTGFARCSYRKLLTIGNSDTDRGKAYVKALAKKVAAEKPSLLFYMAIHLAVKWLGYRLGWKSSLKK